jgi:hypothetical protein
MELAEMAATEQDPEKFMVIIREIDQLLEEKQKRLDARRTPPPSK